MRITRDEAEDFFAHPSQKVMGLTELPDSPFEYYAFGQVCGAFHETFWPDVHMVHVGMKPDGWGLSDISARAILEHYRAETGSKRITTWIDGNNRAAIAFAARLGFTEDGEMALGTDKVIMMGWS